MIVEIDHKSGFCFGVRNAVEIAEKALEKDGFLYSLGHIVHNEKEVQRLQEMGLKSISHEEFFGLSHCKVLIRAHGEPPATYEYARKNGIELIEATCPVVLMLQKRVRKAAEQLNETGQIVIFGHEGHAEVTGLLGQAGDRAIVIDDPDDLKQIDPDGQVIVFSQTTMPVDGFSRLKQNIQNLHDSKNPETHDTICRQVSNRIPNLQEFATRYDIVVFVGGAKSSNARVLYDVCKSRNPQSYFISSPEELHAAWFIDAQKVGVCGATSTPQWLMEQVADAIRSFSPKPE